jgi:hypothetical protein
MIDDLSTPKTDYATVAGREPEGGVYHRGVPQRRRPLRIIVAITVLGSSLAASSSGRHAMLRAAGWFDCADDPIHPADAIVIAVDAGRAGSWRRLTSCTVECLAGSPSLPIKQTMSTGSSRGRIDERGARAPDPAPADAAGVEDIERIPLPITGTEDEGRVFPEWCGERQLAPSSS